MRTHMETKRIEILTRRHRQTGLLVAFSKELSGLLVSGRSLDDLEERLPGSVREMFEALGYEVLGVKIARESEELPPAFADVKFLVNAQVQAA